ncbi:alpha/beta hydrolase [Flavobacterium succinicans]|uniref:Acetyl esterase n=1 Tax=Flavobacterium succinicans TaxID=29536 RepID=A0A199XUR9_9FLAO|nr:alpha/beta hydrolase [Flavobacterium succinicans]OAZ05064.1 acetyl esterase [Flavobacterium succinicans]
MKNHLVVFACLVSCCSIQCSSNDNTNVQPTTQTKYIDNLYTVSKTADLTYANALNIEGNNQILKYDLYQPTEDNQTTRPLIIAIHGGGFIEGSKENPGTVRLCETLTKKGYVSMSINYRLGYEQPKNEKTYSEAVWRAQQDLRAAIRFAKANAAKLRIDASKVFILGGSAGAVTCLNVGYLNQDEAPIIINQTKWGTIEGNSGNLNFSSSVKAIISIAGGLTNPSIIKTGDAPVAFIHCNQDPVVPYNEGLDDNGFYIYGSFYLNNLVKTLAIKTDLLTYISTSHSFAANPENVTQTTDYIAAFLYPLVK